MALLPLESNPDVMNKFLAHVGVPENFHIVDVYGLDPDLLATIPKPVLSVLFLFPTSEKCEEFKLKQESEIKEKGQIVSPNLYYMKQIVQNACGTVALIHSVANNLDQIQLEDGKFKKIFEESRGMTPEERGELVQKYEDVLDAHKTLALEGQTEVPDANQPVYFHFIAFVCKDNCLYELDGRKAFPINHGSSSPDTLLEDAVKVIKEYTSRDPDDIRFTVLALTGDQ